MKKVKVAELKKYLAEHSEAELREEILRLFSKIKQVQDYYAQELMSPEERQYILVEYKKKVDSCFYTRTGNPKIPQKAKLRALIKEFEDIAVAKIDVVDLVLYRVEQTIQLADKYGGLGDNDYSAAVSAYTKALKMITTEKLEPYFEDRCRGIIDGRRNFDYYFAEALENLTEEYLG